MNSLTSLGTLQGLAGATVGLNNINALAGTLNSEYLLLWWTAFPQILPRKWSASRDPQRSQGELKLGMEEHMQSTFMLSQRYPALRTPAFF